MVPFGYLLMLHKCKSEFVFLATADVVDHRGIDTTIQNISDHFSWMSMNADITAFCLSCLHCAGSTSSKVVPRPMGHTLHAEKPNELLHFDYLHMGESTTGHCYILVLKDDASSFIWLEPCLTADAQTTVDVLTRWFSSFGVVLTWNQTGAATSKILS